MFSQDWRHSNEGTNLWWIQGEWDTSTRFWTSHRESREGLGQGPNETVSYRCRCTGNCTPVRDFVNGTRRHEVRPGN